MKVSAGKWERIRTYLADAEGFLEKGGKELEEGVKLNDHVRIRDAAEKLWNVTVNAANALILLYLDVVPASHWERRGLLEKLEELRPEVEKMGLRDRYGARERYLHEMTFYNGIIDPEMLKVEVKKVRRYLDDVRELIMRAHTR